MKKKEPFHALIISSDNARRSRLKLAVHHDQLYGRPAFKSVTTAISLVEGLGKLCRSADYDVVLITDCFDSNSIEDFVTQLINAHEQKIGIVLVLKGSNEDGLTLAKSLVNGIDGLLYEPFSVDMLRQISCIAEQVRKENNDRRITAAGDILLESIAEAIDEAAKKMYSGEPQRPFPKRLKKAAEMFRELSDDGLPAFYEAVIAVTQKGKPFPKKAEKPSKYDGPSEILKKKFAEEEEKKKKEYGNPKKTSRLSTDKQNVPSHSHSISLM